MSKKPLISVIMPLYNKEDMVERTINSVLRQTVSDMELIVVNDGSTDNSVNVAKRFSDSRIILIEQSNGGVAAARNRGIACAASDLIAFLDADDEWESDYLESILRLAEDYPRSSVYATSYSLKDGDVVALPKIPFHAKQGMIDDYFSLACKGSPPIWTGSVTVRKTAILSIGAFEVGIKAGEDLLCWARLAQRYSIAFLNQPKAVYHYPLSLGDNSSVRAPDVHDKVYQGLVELLDAEASGRKRSSINLYIGHWCKMRLHLYAYTGNRSGSLSEYRKLIRHDPLNIRAFGLFMLAIAPESIRHYVLRKRKRAMV